MSTIDENCDYYDRIRSGDSTAIDEMILGNLALAENRLQFFLKGWPRFRHLRDDLYSEAILALTQAVKSFAVGEVDQPTGYLVSRIDHALKNQVDSEIGAGQMSRSTVQRRRSSNDPLPRKLPIDVGNPPAELWTGANGRVNRTKVELESLKPNRRVSRADARQVIRDTTDSGPDSDVLDRILECCETDEERAIVRLRIDGHNDGEIAEQLGLSRQTVNRRREAIEDRYERMKKPGQ